MQPSGGTATDDAIDDATVDLLHLLDPCDPHTSLADADCPVARRDGGNGGSQRRHGGRGLALLRAHLDNLHASLD